MIRGAAQELVVVEILESGMARHRQIGTVDLQGEAGGDDRLVLGLHRGADRLDVVLVGGEVFVALEGGDETGRGGIDEGVGGGSAGGGDGGGEVGEIRLEDRTRRRS